MYDTGSTTFMLICTMLVFLMTPGLAFFYGGLSRRKNVINTMLMCFGAIGLVGVLWIVAGWSLAYGGDGSSPFIGGFDQLLCLPVLNQVLQAAEGNAADGAVYPQIITAVTGRRMCSMPGRIAEAMRQAGVANPLMLLDEIDKVSGDYKGDVASALLEVLDGEQNVKFRESLCGDPFGSFRRSLYRHSQHHPDHPRPTSGPYGGDRGIQLYGK